MQRIVRMDGMLTGVVSTRNRGTVRGRRLGGPFNRLGVILLIEADRLGRGVRALRLPGRTELARIGSYTLQLRLLVPILINLDHEGGVFGIRTQGRRVLAEDGSVPQTTRSQTYGRLI
jgi:hypothetical protein